MRGVHRTRRLTWPRFSFFTSQGLSSVIITKLLEKKKNSEYSKAGNSPAGNDGNGQGPLPRSVRDTTPRALVGRSRAAANTRSFLCTRNYYNAKRVCTACLPAQAVSPSTGRTKRPLWAKQSNANFFFFFLLREVDRRLAPKDRAQAGRSSNWRVSVAVGSSALWPA